MWRALLLLFVFGSALAAAPTLARNLPPVDDLRPAGKWKVVFINGVIESVEIEADGTAFVREPLRTSRGKAVIEDGSWVITFEDDRVERWTPAGERLVAEHFCPASAYPAGKPVLGIAEKAR